MLLYIVFYVILYGFHAILCQLLARGCLADLERLPDLRMVVGLVETIACQEFDYMLAYVMALFCFMLLLCQGYSSPPAHSLRPEDSKKTERYRLETFECRGCGLCRLMFWLYAA